MSKVSYVFIVIVLALVGSFLWNGCETPRQTDAEYLRQYRVLNANNYTDEQILEMRKKDDLETLKWKHTNKLLADEMKARGIEVKALQKGVYQIQFYDAYYNQNVDVKRFLDAKIQD